MENVILNDRIQKASEILKTKDLSSENLQRQIQKTLERIGVDDSDIGQKILEAETTEFEDFEKAFFDGQGLEKGQPPLIVPVSPTTFPKARLKAAWEILKGNDPFKKKSELKINGTGEELKLAEVLKPVENYSDLELLQKYGKECPPRVEEELQKRTHNRPCIIFEEDTGKVDIENSLYMVRKAHRQDTPKTYMIRGELKVLYPIGFFPADVFYECPVHSNVLLVDGYCEECSQVWDTNEYEKNAFLRLITEQEDIDVRIYKGKSFADLKKDFPKIYLKFNELKEEGKLPSLKRRLSKAKEGDPFRVVHTTH